MRARVLLAIVCLMTLCAGKALAQDDTPPPAPAGEAAPPAVLVEPPPPLPPSDAPFGPPPPLSREVVRDGTVRYFGPEVARSGPCPCCPECWDKWAISLEGGVTYLPSVDGPVGLPTGTGSNEFSWDGIDNEIAFAARLGVSFRPTVCDIVMFRGSLQGFWPEQTDRQTNRVLGFAPGDGMNPPVTQTNSATLSTEAQYYGGELHWWRRVGCCENLRAHLGAGIRYLEFDEKATMDDWAQPFAGFNGLPYLQSDAKNRFLGVQFGTMGEWDFCGRWTLSGSIKGMVGGIRYDTTVRDNSFFIGGEHSSSFEQTKFSYGVDVEVGIRWKASQCVSLLASWNFLFLDNVQRASDALDFTDSNSGAVQAQRNTDALVTNTLWLGVQVQF